MLIQAKEDKGGYVARSRYLEAIERVYLNRPHAVAYRCENGAQITYCELWEASDAIAATLAERLPPSRGPIVVFGRKSPLMPQCFLACLKAGCAYVPLDTSTPLDRLCSIMTQLDHPLVLAVDEMPDEAAACSTALLSASYLAEISAQKVSPSGFLEGVEGEDLEYLIFTSGSTGEPKGVQITASCVDNFMDWAIDVLGVRNEPKVIVNQAHFCFDLSVYELTSAFSTGSTIFALDAAAEVDMAQMFSALNASGAQIWVSTPSFADVCLSDPSFSAALMPQMEAFIFCGEPLRPATAANLHKRFPAARITNSYGPTESTVAVTAIDVSEELLVTPECLPVGYARPGTVISIVDHETRAVLVTGQVGEIVITGDTVALGYLGLPERTAQSFATQHLATGKTVRSYYTGDKGYLDGRGLLYCQGRFDNQIKLNGFRIELGEIEVRLAALPYMKNAVVIAAQRRGRNTHLVAYVALSEYVAENDFEIAQVIRNDLARRLPAYMLPKKVRVIDDFPLTDNGKIDRKALCLR